MMIRCKYKVLDIIRRIKNINNSLTDVRVGDILEVTDMDSSVRFLYHFMNKGDKLEVMHVSPVCNRSGGCLEKSHKNVCIFVKHINSNSHMYLCSISAKKVNSHE